MVKIVVFFTQKKGLHFFSRKRQGNFLIAFFESIFFLIFLALIGNKLIFGFRLIGKNENILYDYFHPIIGPLQVGFTQSLNVTSLLLQLVKPFCSKEMEELKIVPNWCFGDKRRFLSFAEQTTLQPLENRNLDEITKANLEKYGKENIDAIFDDKENVYSTLFWMTHWAMRQGTVKETKCTNL